MVKNTEARKVVKAVQREVQKNKCVLKKVVRMEIPYFSKTGVTYYKRRYIDSC